MKKYIIQVEDKQNPLLTGDQIYFDFRQVLDTLRMMLCSIYNLCWEYSQQMMCHVTYDENRKYIYLSEHSLAGRKQQFGSTVDISKNWAM